MMSARTHRRETLLKMAFTFGLLSTLINLATIAYAHQAIISQSTLTRLIQKTLHALTLSTLISGLPALHAWHAHGDTTNPIPRTVTTALITTGILTTLLPLTERLQLKTIAQQLIDRCTTQCCMPVVPMDVFLMHAHYPLMISLALLLSLHTAFGEKTVRRHATWYGLLHKY